VDFVNAQTGKLDMPSFYNLGYKDAGENGIIILDFGQPWCQGYDGVNEAKSCGSSPVYGAILHISSNAFAPISDIEEAAQQFAEGYYKGAPTSHNHIRLVLGLNNYLGDTTSGNGAAWAQMVNAVNSYINAPPSYASRIEADGGIDSELEYNTYQNTYNWVWGYDLSASYRYYYYGDCTGCDAYDTYASTKPVPGATWTVAAQGVPGAFYPWSQDDVVNVAYVPGWAHLLPQIYSQDATVPCAGCDGAEWKDIVVYNYKDYGGVLISIEGSLTEQTACSQVGICGGIDNSPRAGWTQLWYALNAGSDRQYTAQLPTSSSDIGYMHYAVP